MAHLFLALLRPPAPPPAVQHHDQAPAARAQLFRSSARPSWFGHDRDAPKLVPSRRLSRLPSIQRVWAYVPGFAKRGGGGGGGRGDGEKLCTVCEGDGFIRCRKCDGYGHQKGKGEEVFCPDCEGAGIELCPNCEGGCYT